MSIGASSVAVEAKDILLPGISFVESDKLTSAAVGEEMPEGVLLNCTSATATRHMEATKNKCVLRKTHLVETPLLSVSMHWGALS